jgi:hypothetical protein
MQDSFSNPSGSGPILGALSWLQGTLRGTAATIVAVIAVASVGFLLLTGRMNWRYGATVILGCFMPVRRGHHRRRHPRGRTGGYRTISPWSSSTAIRFSWRLPDRSSCWACRTPPSS